MTGRKQRAIVALLNSPTRAAAAEASGVGISTLRRWMREDPAFRVAYQAALDELLRDASAQTQRSLSPAIKALTEIVEDEAQPATARISAARSLIEFGLRLNEAVTVAERLDTIEQAIDGLGGESST